MKAYLMSKEQKIFFELTLLCSDSVALSLRKLRSGRITADMRFGSCRASTQIAFGNFSYPQTLYEILFCEKIKKRNFGTFY